MKPYLKHAIPIEKHNLWSIYAREIGFLAFQIKKNCELIFVKTPLPEKGYSILASNEIHILIYNVLIYAAKIKKLIIAPKKRSNQTEIKFNTQCRRANLLFAYFEDLEITEMFDNKVRNSLEHFDEYLDDEIYKLVTDQNYIPSSAAGHNLVYSHWEVYTSRPLPIRIYISSEKKYYNFDKSIDIGKIYDETVLICERILNLKIAPLSEDGEINNASMILL